VPTVTARKSSARKKDGEKTGGRPVHVEKRPARVVRKELAGLRKNCSRRRNNKRESAFPWVNPHGVLRDTTKKNRQKCTERRAQTSPENRGIGMPPSPSGLLPRPQRGKGKSTHKGRKRIRFWNTSKRRTVTAQTGALIYPWNHESPECSYHWQGERKVPEREVCRAPCQGKVD